MRKVKMRLLIWFFSLLFFFQTHPVFSILVLQKQESSDDSGNKKSFSNYVLEPVQSLIRIATHSSHSSHSSHRSHSSHSSHQSSSYGTTYSLPRTTTYTTPSYYSTPIKKEAVVQTPVVLPNSKNIEPNQVYTTGNSSYTFTIPKRIVVHQNESKANNTVSTAIWDLLIAKMEEEYQIVFEKDKESNVNAGIDVPAIIKEHYADFYLTGYIFQVENLYVSSIEFNDAQGKKVKIQKASDSIDMLIISILSCVKEQVGL
jgi:hypothetical protein